MFKHLEPIAIKNIVDLFNSCLEQGEWVWDIADVIFLKKNGKKKFNEPGSYIVRYL